MKIVIAALMMASVLSGCVVEPLYSHHGGYGYRDGYSNRDDRDHDAARNYRDRYPNNPRRY